MKDLQIKQGTIICVSLSSLPLFGEYAKEKIFGFNMIGKLLIENNHHYIILKYRDRNQTITNHQRVPMMIINQYRTALPEEKALWKKSNRLFTTTMYVNYNTYISTVTQLTAVSAVRKWCEYYSLYPERMNNVVVPESMQQYVADKLKNASGALLQRGAELSINRMDIEANQQFKKNDLNKLLTGYIKGVPVIYNLFTTEIELVWKIASNLKRQSKLNYLILD